MLKTLLSVVPVNGLFAWQCAFEVQFGADRRFHTLFDAVFVVQGLDGNACFLCYQVHGVAFPDGIEILHSLGLFRCEEYVLPWYELLVVAQFVIQQQLVHRYLEAFGNVLRGIAFECHYIHYAFVCVAVHGVAVGSGYSRVCL